MLTPFGKAIRKIRIDHAVTLKDVADLVGVSSAYLSGIETGRKPLTSDFVEKLLNVWNVEPAEESALVAAAAQHISEVRINPEGKSSAEMEVAMMFARKFSSGSLQLDRFKSLLEEDD